MAVILVTGGAGFIGSTVVRMFIQQARDTVINVDKLTYAGNLDTLAGVFDEDRHVFKQVDICDGSAVKRIFDEFQPDAVMHLAAESHVDRSIDGPSEFVNTNIVGTYAMLENTREYWNVDAQLRPRARGGGPHPRQAGARPDRGAGGRRPRRGTG